MESIINDKWCKERNENIEDEKERIEGEQWLPKSLVKFLRVMVPSKRKCVSIGQSIIYAARPKYAFPLILSGLAIELDYVFGSRWLVEQLSRLPGCISYEEVTIYKESVLQSERAEDNVAMAESSFTQWSADNVDHNIATRDGNNTCYGMGIIVSTKSSRDNLAAPLPQITRKKQIPVESQLKTWVHLMKGQIYQDFQNFGSNHALSSQENTLWHL